MLNKVFNIGKQQVYYVCLFIVILLNSSCRAAFVEDIYLQFCDKYDNSGL